MEIPELVPLEGGGGNHYASRQPRRQFSRPSTRSWHKAPVRACRLLSLLVILPALFIFIPMYMRYRVFSGQMYPMGMTDMRLIDSKISTTWCQRQVVRSNTTFNAFVMPDSPKMAQQLVPVSMTRQLELEDDMKEYWGFYLLQGSTVTVSTCVRWPGASLIMIKGYKHLQECAYIGDDSSEELDELLEANKLGLLSNSSLLERLLRLNKEDGPANDPDTMQRHKGGVSFHDPSHDARVPSPGAVPSYDVTDHDPKELREILEKLHAIRQAAKDEAQKMYTPPPHLVALPALHRHRDTNVDRDERRWLSFNDLDAIKVVDENKRIAEEDKTAIDDTNRATTIDNDIEINKPTHKNNKEGGVKKNSEKQNSLTTTTEQPVEKSDSRINKTVGESLEKIDGNLVNTTKFGGQIAIDSDSSREVYEEVLRRLQLLGDRGQRVLKRLHEAMAVKIDLNQSEDKTAADHNAEMKELDHLSQVLIEAIDEERKRPERQQKRHEALLGAKVKRELMIGASNFEKELNEDDEARDFAAEEDLEPDGYAEHHSRVNETTAFDMSNSEFWSSFSSSEEALLECEGLILNLPLTPHPRCRRDGTDDQRLAAAQRNAVTYRVPANGYYFFVFNSENEVQTNYISVRFDLHKTIYDVTLSSLRACMNRTARCDLPLDLFSTQKVVLELPLRDNESLWNEQFVVLSECEPRTSIYISCVIAVPLLIMIFAFQ